MTSLAIANEKLNRKGREVYAKVRKDRAYFALLCGLCGLCGLVIFESA
jgi:hypothetical protein